MPNEGWIIWKTWTPKAFGNGCNNICVRQHTYCTKWWTFFLCIVTTGKTFVMHNAVYVRRSWQYGFQWAKDGSNQEVKNGPKLIIGRATLEFLHIRMCSNVHQFLEFSTSVTVYLFSQVPFYKCVTRNRNKSPCAKFTDQKTQVTANRCLTSNTINHSLNKRLHTRNNSCFFLCLWVRVCWITLKREFV